MRVLPKLIQKISVAAFLFVGLPATLQANEIADLQDFQIDLKDPIFHQGVITTDKGGIITSEGIRIQAQKIEYINRTENGVAVRKVIAEGDLLFQYGYQAFVGRRLEFDFKTRTGVIEDGKTHVELWYVGGEKIYLESDGGYYIRNAFLTTSASDDPLWEVHVGKIQISEDRMLSANNLKFKFAKIPFFWIPGFRANLNFVKKPPIRYKIKWDKGLGPRISARWEIYSWEHFDMFLRGDYRIAKGGGAAIETSYLSEDDLTEFVTKSYGSIDDPSTPIEHGLDHYRLQGLYQSRSRDGKTTVHMAYDKISDIKMIGEFPSDDFEINTNKRTHLFIHHHEKMGFADLSFQPRINPWQSLNQELPVVTFGIRPFAVGSSGIIMQNWSNAGLLDYVYAHKVDDYIHNTRSWRVETNNSIYRPIRLGHVTVTPDAGLIAIFYSNNPYHHSIGQVLGTYGLHATTRLEKQFKHFEHVAEPYLDFRGLTRPTASTKEVLIFGIEDGYQEIDALRVGFKNSFYPRKYKDAPPRLSADLYTYGFFGNHGYLTTFPRFYLDLATTNRYYKTNLEFAWNIQEKVIDRINARTRWTINDDIAFMLEMRHRSKFDWRKADHENFILDVARPLNQLLQSTVSDGRNTLLVQAQIRLHPLWMMHIAGHGGWARGKEPPYHSAKVDLYTTVITGWRLRVSGSVTAGDVTFDTGIELLRQ